MCGMTGKFVQRRGQHLQRCYLLDPVGPGFDGGHDSRRAMSGDCAVVVSVHTTEVTMTNYPISRLHVPGFGSSLRDADCNFIVNDGSAYEQPGCLDLKQWNSMQNRVNRHRYRDRGPAGQMCGHARALSLFLNSLQGSCDLVAQDEEGRRMQFPPLDQCSSGMDRRLNITTKRAGRPFC